MRSDWLCWPVDERMMKILQVGLGNFGRNHLRAWHELGLGDKLYLAERDPALHVTAREFRFPSERITTNIDSFWKECDIVDVVTGTESHFAICRHALLAGKDVFVEKPMTPTLKEAVDLAELVARSGRVLQVGYYYRYHPISQWLKEQIVTGALGTIRYLAGEFMGFKRARNDVGVMHTDGIHFIDLFNWLLGGFPSDVYAVTRDHFKRGLEDFALALFTYPGAVVARVEAGYIQPGRWRDKVVAGAMTTKSITVVGSLKTVTADFESEEVQVFDVHHELQSGVWTAVRGGASWPNLPTAAPLDQIKAELTDFLAHVRERRRPLCDATDSGVRLAAIMEALYRSAGECKRVEIKDASR